VAEEVDEENFFHSRETGGTVVSSALKLMRKVIETRYGNGLWNIYGAQASDGDNWLEDSVLCYQLLHEQILGLTQYYAYIEIAEDTPQNLWEEYEKVQSVHPDVFAMRRIKAVTDIYPVFHESRPMIRPSARSPRTTASNATRTCWRSSAPSR
jgi:hypothetical protein